MREQPDLSDDFRNALENHQPAANLDRIETRVCASDDFDGTEYEFYGWYIPARPIIEVAASHENFAIESMSYINEGDEPKLNIFLADLRQSQPHPAFTEV